MGDYLVKRIKPDDNYLQISVTNKDDISLKPDKDNIDIVNLNIVLYTNKDSKVNLKSSLFVFDDGQTIKGGDSVLLCTNVNYNTDYFVDKTLFEKVQTFFSQAEFKKFVLSSNDLLVTNADQVRKTTRENIFIMLKTLFPISFPIKDDVIRMSDDNALFDFESIFQKVFRRSEYVYLNIDHVCTVTQVIWLDTVSSNPVYVQLDELMKKYKKNLISYVLDKYVRTAEKSVKRSYGELSTQLKNISSRAIESGRFTVIELKPFFSLNSKKFNEDKDKERNLLSQIKQLKKIFAAKGIIRYDEEMNIIESHLKVDESADKTTIEKIFEQYKNGNYTDDDLRKRFATDYTSHGSTWWKLYFIFAGLKKNTAEYNSFVDEYVKKHVLQTREESRNWYYYNNSQSSNESKFYKNLSDLDFHFEFLKKIEDFMLQRRKSSTREVSEIFQEEEGRYVIHIDKYLTMFRDNTQKRMNAGVDIMRQLKEKGEENSKSSDYKTKFYEIQLGVALVGGKVPNSPSSFWCTFNSIKLANDYKFLTKYDIGEIKLYPYVEIQEEPNNGAVQNGRAVQRPNQELSTILNLKKGGRRNKSHKKRSFVKKTRKRSF